MSINQPKSSEIESIARAVRDAVPDWIGKGIFVEVHKTMDEPYARDSENLIVAVYPLVHHVMAVPFPDRVGPYFDGSTPNPDAVVTDEWIGVPQNSDSKPDLPHPGISDEFWAKVPEEDRESFSAYLVREDATTRLAEAMDVPRDVITDPLTPRVPETPKAEDPWPLPDNLQPAATSFPEVTVSRGGMSFSGGWCTPSATAYHVKPLTKKELRRQVKRLTRALAEARKQRNDIERDLRRARKIIKRLTR